MWDIIEWCKTIFSTNATTKITNNDDELSKSPKPQSLQNHQNFLPRISYSDNLKVGESTSLLKKRFISPESTIYSLQSLKSLWEGRKGEGHNNYETFSYDETDLENGEQNLLQIQHYDVVYKELNYEEHITDENAKLQKRTKETTRRLSADTTCLKQTGYNLLRRSELWVIFIEHPPPESAYRFTFYSTATNTVRARSLAEIPPSGSTLSEMLKAGCWWIDIYLKQLLKCLNLEGIIIPHHIYNSEYLYSGNEGENHFVSFSRPSNVRRRIKLLKDYITVYLIDDITDSFAPSSFCGLLRLLGSKADVMKGLIKRCNEFRCYVIISNEIVLYFGDIQEIEVKEFKEIREIKEMGESEE
ncbi:hypothetical protein Glove_88g41 [Diversispora epigaea]|uniref:Uncharacterized protein n=1 Tax=Diversispora epigaea TaxID=1348612 RepID=A0A397JCT5_9GLOM|nr:hypothetical protein Glove_88g41 [Diversispora epigaea]